ncbi:hypothetical protein DFH08DRAFT_971380 [Mycena albidolilacea]|uniref:DUF6532 domain-containing protein n=1 Tax=Mycena albidolilacea TaxID=1033008 RepID=A0AAD7EG04_9AGAR|nr:hypothetical protein DFH08DRAFT_971380 [Mycena albidolilacea]
MPPRRVDDSDSDSNDETPAAQPPKKSRASRDDLSGNQTLDNRTRNAASRKPSEKQSANEKENLESQQTQRLQAAEREVMKMRKKVAVMEAQAPSKDRDDEYESEDNGFDEPPNAAFVSSINPLGRLPVAPPRQTVPLRKTSKTNATKAPKISSQAFKNLPELPLDQRNLNDISPSPSPTHGGRCGDDDDQDDGMDGDFADLPNRTPTHASNGGPVTGEKRPRALSQSSPDPPPKRTKSKGKDAKLRDGFVQQPGVKPAAGDYEPIVAAILLRACGEYSARIVASKFGGFPGISIQYQWAEECFKNACRSSKEHYKLTRRMAKLITKRGSHVRGKLIDTYCPLFATNYGFQRSQSKKAIAANQLKAQTLLRKAAFHYKDPSTRTGYAKNPIITEARSQYIFKNKKALGAIFSLYFNPISAEYLALDFTISLTQEWSTGVEVRTKFSEKDMSEAYQTHLTDINEKWIKCNPTVTEKLRRKWYKRAAQDFAPAEPEQCTNIDAEDQDAIRMELEGRTGDTDSEEENDVNDDPLDAA